MQELKIFNNEEFGQVRTIEIDGRPYFVGKDIANALGYKDTVNALKQHCRGVVKHHLMDSMGRKQTVSAITEGDMYRLITHSKLESAERFESWVFDEVLPTLRKTGSYKMPKKEKQAETKKLPLSSVNMMVKNIKESLKEAEVEPIYIAAEVKRLYTDAGYPVTAPLITDKATMPKLYDCTEIAKELGIYSTSGKPHNQAVSAILSKLDIKEDEIVTTAFIRNGHEDITAQYKPSVYIKVQDWLEDNSYPVKIPYTDSKGNYKTYAVVYGKVA